MNISSQLIVKSQNHVYRVSQTKTIFFIYFNFHNFHLFSLIFLFRVTLTTLSPYSLYGPLIRSTRSPPSPAMRINEHTSSHQRSTILKSNSQVIDELSQLQTSTGVANIPNQVHYHHSKRKININVLLFGKSHLYYR